AMNGFEYYGIWWLPANPDNTVPGILTFTNEDGIGLQLLGTLGDFSTFNTRKPYPLILGISSEGKEITLIDCWTAGLNIGSGFARESYKSTFCLLGAHFDAPDKIL